MKVAKLLLLSFFFAALLAACGDDGGSGPSNSEPALSSDAGSSGDGSSDDNGYSSEEDDSDGSSSSRKKRSSSSSFSAVASSKTNSSIANQSSASSGEEQDPGLGACSETNDGELKQDARISTVSHVCDNGEWRRATKIEKDVGFGCTVSMIGEERLSVGYVICSQPGAWIATATIAGTLAYGGQTYKTIGIGAQTWMAENLNYATDGSWCYNNSADSCAKYGRLYTWSTAMDSATTGCGYDKTCAASKEKVRGVCPPGWHLPSRDDWNTLITVVGDSAGTKLKSATGWNSNGNGSDAYGFSALPSGEGRFDVFDYAGDYAWIWSSSEYNRYRAYSICLTHRTAYASFNDASKSEGFAVRCVKD